MGLRPPHYRDLLAELPAVGFIEVHSENYFGAGGPPLRYLERARAHYPLSLHGVGLSLGSTDPLGTDYLNRLAALIERFQPALVSDHLCWTANGARHFHELLPLPYTEEALDWVARRIIRVQERLGRRILVENIASYFEYRHSTIPEPEFLAALATRADCGLLLDVNNLYVSARNHGWQTRPYLDALPAHRVRELHLAGHSAREFDGVELCIDTHDAPVSAEVWRLYDEVLRRFGPLPTLIEWDASLPPLATLVAQVTAARERLDDLPEQRRALAR